jgi:sulfite oxidase
MFTQDEVYARRDPKNGKVLVSYRYGVYDITDFIESHPGGEKILLAAGNGIDTFWKMYPQHMTPEVIKILESLRVGNLKDANVTDAPTKSDVEMWGAEPKRHPALIVHTKQPMNAETPPALLHTPLTPNELFFVRNHLPVPNIKAEDYKLEIGGDGLRQVKLSLSDLKEKFPRYSVTSVVQCSGNRRSEVGRVGTVRGLGWTTGAIGNAVWSGARLRDVLDYAGLDPKTLKANHILFEGLDKDMISPYEVSIPIDKALSEYGDVLLAYEMNGEVLPPDHGYPIRAVVPGTVGARQCKWLAKVTTSDTESQGIYQQKDYKSFAPGTSMDGSKVPSIQELPVQSSITEPAPNSVASDFVPVKGYAWSGGGRAINRVDLTTNNGKTWTQATLQRPDGQVPNRTWAWTLFESNVMAPEGLKPGDKFQVCSRAVDSGNNVQPERAEPTYHIRGMLCNKWSCVDYKVGE